VAHRDKKTGKLMIESTAKDLSVAYIHSAPSTNIAFEEMLAVQPVSLDLSTNQTVNHSLGGLTVHLEPWHLPGNRMFDLGARNGHPCEFEIDHSAYRIQSPIPIVNLGGELPPTGTVQIRCWKVAVENAATGIKYDMECSGDWSLAAMEISQKWKPTLELRLLRKGGQA
jgi:hypothetical protein